MYTNIQRQLSSVTSNHARLQILEILNSRNFEFWILENLNTLFPRQFWIRIPLFLEYGAFYRARPLSHNWWNLLSGINGGASRDFSSWWKGKGIFLFCVYLADGGMESRGVGVRPREGKPVSPTSSGRGVEWLSILMTPFIIFLYSLQCVAFIFVNKLCHLR